MNMICIEIEIEFDLMNVKRFFIIIIFKIYYLIILSKCLSVKFVKVMAVGKRKHIYNIILKRRKISQKYLKCDGDP